MKYLFHTTIDPYIKTGFEGSELTSTSPLTMSNAI